ncbi:hypothetical protein Poly21_08350 [Allorhodopirellula heiligendammensis]|uniref:Uncharacterized protein n=1 Tax=Allorhodopirellula heiligendammensis TaxID=2714739 RepID=A0A5C6C553_9BACT|nr:hypothetical protein Poly21_08350 [Allorhodopirellula heiligendammensis]
MMLVVMEVVRRTEPHRSFEGDWSAHRGKRVITDHSGPSSEYPPAKLPQGLPKLPICYYASLVLPPEKDAHPLRPTSYNPVTLLCPRGAVSLTRPLPC